MLALPLSPVMMLVFVVVLLFLLGWPFEWPAIILVFLPIFYPDRRRVAARSSASRWASSPTWS